MTNNMKILLFVAVLLIASLGTSCVAQSKFGDAVISDSDGLPCFAVPGDSDTRGGIPFEALTVTEEVAIGAATAGKDVWHFRIMPSGNSIKLRPDICIRYGVKPDSAEQGEFEVLKKFQVYSVHLQVALEDSNRTGYNGKFCIIPLSADRTRVQVVPWDEKVSKWRYDLCIKT
jgi:hypothetical protein